jgi:hypothetical protein
MEGSKPNLARSKMQEDDTLRDRRANGLALLPTHRGSSYLPDRAAPSMTVFEHHSTLEAERVNERHEEASRESCAR